MKSPFLYSLALAGLVGVTALPAAAKDFTDKYVDANLKDLVEFTVRNKGHNVESLPQYSDYLKVTNCQLFTSLEGSQFKLEELRQKFVEQVKAAQKESTEIYFRIPFSVRVSNYNFDTQSIDILQDSQLKNVKSIQVLRDETTLCDGSRTGSLETVPSIYTARLNYPISLYRIPLQKNISESLFNKLNSSVSDHRVKIIYGNMFLQVDAAEPEDLDQGMFKRSTVRGQINAIDLYIDQDRKIPIKRLDYTAGF